MGLQDKEKRLSSREAWVLEASRAWGESSKQLSLSVRFLFAQINRFKRIADSRFTFTATDGENIFYNPMKLAMRARQGIVFINRAYIHMLMHCIFPAIRKAEQFSGEERRLWDIASDIHAEYIADGFQSAALMLPESDLKQQAYKKFIDRCGILSVENIFTCLKSESERDLGLWEEIFYLDDHSLWVNVKKESRDNQARQSAALASVLAAYGRGRGEERLFKALKVSERRKVSYTEFLKKFMQLRENAKIDPDSFDPGYYNYGLTVYGDMPLIEELEMREESRAEELLIVLDTSGSCAGEPIRAFLEETFTMLRDLRSLSECTRVRLLQCDRDIVSERIVSPFDDLSGVLSETELRGFGGTDFRPPFKYARELLNQGKRVSGLIYFTDGYGIYPVARPPFKSAFVFAKEPDFEDEERMRLAGAFAAGAGDQGAVKPPGWAVRYVMGEG